MSKYSKVIIMLLIISILLVQIVGCQSNMDRPAKIETNIEPSNNGKTASNSTSKYSEKKATIKEAVTNICNNAHQLYNIHNRLVDPDLDTENLQILVVSNILKTAYLINSQNKKYGNKDEIIEYSTTTIDKSILVIPFQNIDFNGHPTYAFNIDSFYSYLKNENRNAAGFEELVTTTLFHEGIHIFLQLKFHKDDKAKRVNELGNTGSKSVQYPIIIEDYIYRAQMAHAYKQALSAGDITQKIEYIKEANYFLQKFLANSEENQRDINLDLIEGQPRYYEYKAKAILEGLRDKEAIKKRAKELLIVSHDNTKPLAEIDKGSVCYQTGSNAFALINDLGERDELGVQNPVLYLMDKYGVKESEGDLKLSSDIRNKYTKINNQLKAEIDDISQKISSDDYVTIAIPSVPGSYMSTGGKSLMVNYELNNYMYNTVTTTMELTLQNNRIKISNSKILQLGAGEIRVKTIEDFPPAYYVFVPKDSVTFEGNLITAQSKDIQMYDMKFVEKNGIYILEE